MSAKQFTHLPQIVGVFALLPLILFLDSPWLAQRFVWGQWAANILTFAYFYWMWRGAGLQLKKLMIIGLFIATAGEVIFSLLVGMYEYRLGNIPFYVPPGHTIVYAAVYYWTKSPWVLRHTKKLAIGMYVAIATFSTYWYLTQNDLYGFVLFLIFSAFVSLDKGSYRFFLPMYLLVCYLELIGTWYGNWYWHSYLLNLWPSIPSGNPPSGIAVFYIAFDVGCLGFYMLTNLDIRARYDRRKAYKKARRKELRAA